MFNFVVNKAIQVFTLRFALDSARNENSEGSKILHHQNIFCFCHVTNSLLYQGIHHPVFPFDENQSKPFGLADSLFSIEKGGLAFG